MNGQVLSNIVAIAAGRTHSIGLKEDGSVAIWGADNSGRKLNPSSGLTNAAAVAAGWDHCLVLNKDGAVIRVGAEGSTLLGVRNAVAIACGKTYGFGSRPGADLVLTSDGYVIALGEHSNEPLPPGLKTITAISTGGAANLALFKDGRVFGWGVNNRGQATGVPTANYISRGFVALGEEALTNVTAISAGGDFSLALKSDGTVVAWGATDLPAARVPAGLSNVVAIAAGNDFSLAITTNPAVAARFMQEVK